MYIKSSVLKHQLHLGIEQVGDNGLYIKVLNPFKFLYRADLKSMSCIKSCLKFKFNIFYFKNFFRVFFVFKKT